VSGSGVPDGPAFLYDADCGFCTRSVRWLGRRTGRREPFHAWQGQDLEALGTTEDRLRREAVWWDGRAVTAGGADAFSAYLRHCGGAWAVPGVLLALPGVRHVVRLVYRWIAANRHRLPGDDACAL